MITDIRLRSQQLVNPGFDDPRELVAWMGAIQGQDYNMAKWAVGVRLKKANLQRVEEALEKGEILRTHVMRLTWHLVAAEDILRIQVRGTGEALVVVLVWVVIVCCVKTVRIGRTLIGIDESESCISSFLPPGNIICRIVQCRSTIEQCS